MSAGGWVTSVTKDGTENLVVAARGKRQAPQLGASSTDAAASSKALQTIMDSVKGGGKEALTAAAQALAKAAQAGAGKAGVGMPPQTAQAAALAAALAAKSSAQGQSADKFKGARSQSNRQGSAAAQNAQATTPRSAAAAGGSGTTPRTARGEGGSSSAPHTPKSAKGPAGGGSHSGGTTGADKQKREEAELQAKREQIKRDVQDAREALAKVVSKKVFEEKDFRYTRNEAHRPSGKAEEMPSRHGHVPLCGLVLMFNCHRSSFELLQGDLATLPESEAIDIKSLLSNNSLGRVKIAPEKGTPFVDRVEFPNDWKLGEDHGLEHNGLQGDGCLVTKLEWKSEKEGAAGVFTPHAAFIKVNPWLAYGCGEGARLSLRKPGATEGTACTVQRILRDDQARCQ